jgi:hypothetical protein
VIQSDGSVQNKYTLKILNKMTEAVQVELMATGPEGLVLVGAGETVTARKGNVTARTVFVRVPRQNLQLESQPIVFHARGRSSTGTLLESRRESVFIAPRHGG